MLRDSFVRETWRLLEIAACVTPKCYHSDYIMLVLSF